MNKWLKIILALAVIGILAALYVWFFMYNKPHRDYQKATPDHELAAEELYLQYRQDKKLADSLYTGMVVQINGDLQKVESRDTISIIVFVFDQGMFGDEGIRCILLPGQEKMIADLRMEEAVIVKGYCTGYNDTDVILEKASLVVDD